MDGRNSSGRTVSLLNDSRGDLKQQIQQQLQQQRQQQPTIKQGLSVGARYQSLSQSRSPVSQASTPGFSPQTPPLTRSESSDSQTFASPSPLTPQSTSFDPQSKQYALPTLQGSHLQSHKPWSKMDDHPLYPPISGNASLPPYALPPLNAANLPHDSHAARPDSPLSDSHVSIASNASAHRTNQKKSQYPCPLAKQYKCSDFFTTSGHAARHAKKHTGRKDAICPECNKAFTRKDNMEQHRRTHQNHRGPSTKSSGSENRVKKPSKAGRKSEKGIPNANLESVASDLDQAEPIHAPLSAADDYLPSNPAHQPTMHPASGGGPGPYYMSPDPIASLPLPMSTDYGVRPPLYRTNYSALDFGTTAITPSLGDPIDLHFNYPSPGLSNGLNCLALVASQSDHRRMSEEAASSKSTSTTP